MMNFPQKIRKTILRHNLVSKNDRILIGVSGGADSISLLHTLYQLRYEFNLNLYVAHLNHGLRKSAVQDERFTVKAAKQLGVPILTKEINLKKMHTKGSAEELARKARFDFLTAAAKKLKCTKIALGHTKDDLAETVLMRILRGSGLYGMRAILPKREINGFTFIRPLLDASRREVEAFLKTARIKYREDPTNTDLGFFRNKVRLKLLPLLSREYNKDVKNVLANLAQSSASDYDLLKSQALKLFKKIAKTRSGAKTIKLKLNQLQKLHPSLQRTLIRLAIDHLKGNTRKLTFAHIDEINDLMANRPSGSQVHLPDDLIILKKEGDIIVAVRKSC